MKAMAKQIEDRYASMAELSEVLKEYLSTAGTTTSASTSPDLSCRLVFRTAEPQKKFKANQDEQELATEGLGARFATWRKSHTAHLAYLWVIAVFVICVAIVLYRQLSPTGVNRNLASQPVPVVKNTVGMQLTLVPAGEFMMGSRVTAEEVTRRFDSQAEFYEYEHPLHRVKITKPFYMGMHEVTVRQFREFVQSSGYQD